jgi:flagellar basal body-associated protein FliL
MITVPMVAVAVAVMGVIIVTISLMDKEATNQSAYTKA